MDVKIDVERMRQAFRGISWYGFTFGDLVSREVPVEDIQDVRELRELLNKEQDLSVRAKVLGIIRVRAEAILNRKPELPECLGLLFMVPENSEADRLVGARIAHIITEKVGACATFQEACALFTDECEKSELFLATFMRIVGEKFFPAP